MNQSPGPMTSEDISEADESEEEPVDDRDDEIIQKIKQYDGSFAFDDNKKKKADIKDIPSILSDENTYHLTDLVNSDFEMNTKDEDFSLSLEQLIKGVKCMLYRFNLVQRKNTLERAELRDMLVGKLDSIE